MKEKVEVVTEVVKLDKQRIQVIEFLIENFNAIVQVMKDRLTSRESDWDPQWPNTLSLSHQCAMLAKKLGQPELVYRSANIFGQILLLLDNRERANETFLFLRDYAEENNGKAYECEAFRLLGLAYNQSKNYERAVICFKMVLQIAQQNQLWPWIILAHQGLSIQYFRLNSISQSQYYRDRVPRLILESHQSAQTGQQIPTAVRMTPNAIGLTGVEVPVPSIPEFEE